MTISGLHPVSSRPRVVIAGGGVAAVEAVLALRDLVGHQISIDLVAPERELPHRPSSVATPFGFGPPPALDLNDLARRHAVSLHPTTLASVNAKARRVRTADGEELRYDYLLLAHGARAVDAIPGALTFTGAANAAGVERVVEAAARREIRRIVVAIPSQSSWQLPAYELALMTAIDLQSRGVRDVELTMVTPERSPLWLFGPAAGDAIFDVLAARGITVRTNATPKVAHAGQLVLGNGEALPADSVIALPALRGAAIPGTPTDERGFLPTDAHGRVAGVDDVLAAGDTTAFPVKQGGLATQQADAAAESIASALGAIDRPAPFRPVLRGLLLTGGAPLYLRAQLELTGEPEMTSSGARRLHGETSSRALWWPPGKIAGRYLAPYLAEARPVGLENRHMLDRTPAGRPVPGDHDEAVELALLLADEDAATGDLRLALEALEAAAALSGGVLPSAYVERRDRWRAALS